MKLLFDQNLNHRLFTSLEDVFPGSQHARSAGLAEADDLAIWEYAAAHRFVIGTQDSDYADWNKLRGAPPLIVWLRCGNASTSASAGYKSHRIILSLLSKNPRSYLGNSIPIPLSEHSVNPVKKASHCSFFIELIE